MKRTLLLLVIATTALGGCLVRDYRHDNRRVRACPPSTHWEDGGCRHNGHKDDHGRGRDRDGDDHKHRD